MKKAKVLVAGAGPVGLFTALNLTRKNIPVRIIDRADGPNEESYALGLHPSSMLLLEEVVVLQRFDEKVRKVREIELFNLSGRRLGGVKIADTNVLPSYVYAVHQGAVEHALIQALADLDVHVEWNSELTMIEENASGVSCSVTHYGDLAQGYGTTNSSRIAGREKTDSYEFLVGADGAHSLVRRLSRIPMIRYGKPKHYVSFEFSDLYEQPDKVRIILDEGHSAAIWPLKKNRARWSFEIPPGVHTPGRESDLRSFILERAPWFKVERLDIHWSCHVSFALAHADTFARGRVYLAGDSAHQTFPYGMQSMNHGLSDARLVSDVLSSSGLKGNVQDAEERYNKARLIEWKWLMNESSKKVRNDADWFSKYRGDLASSLPFSGTHLDIVLEALKENCLEGIAATSEVIP